MSLAVTGVMSMRFIKSSLILGVGVSMFIAITSAVAQDKDTMRPLSVLSKAASGAVDKALLTVTPEYIIGPEDILEITVWKNADLSKQVQVRPDGRISLPLLGDISAVAKTPVQLTEEISTGLRAYMESPTISIMVKEVNSYRCSRQAAAHKRDIPLRRYRRNESTITKL